MHLHKDGLAFLANFFFFFLALILAIVVGAWTGAAFAPLLWLLERAAEICPPPQKRGDRASRRALANRANRIFNAFCVVLLLLAVVDFFSPEPYHITLDWAGPLLLGAFVLGVLIIFIASRTWDDRVGWQKWTFWFAAFITVLSTVAVTRALHLQIGRAFLFPMFLAAIVFFWSFGLLRRIDRNNAELRRLGVTREFASPMNDPAEAALQPQRAHQKNRHKRH